MAQVTVNVDRNVLAKANAVLESSGIDLDLAVTLLLRRTILEGALPFDLSPVTLPAGSSNSINSGNTGSNIGSSTGIGRTPAAYFPATHFANAHFPTNTTYAGSHLDIDAPLQNVQTVEVSDPADLTKLADPTRLTDAPETESPQVTRPLPSEVPAYIDQMYSNLKIGKIANTALRELLQSDAVTEQEVALMLTKDYSTETFNLAFPLLVRHISRKNTKNYYAAPLHIHGEDYYLCSQWYEGPKNNDRPYLLRWIAAYSE